jgi:hypothetical protein
MIKHYCEDFEKAVNYDDFAYYRVEDDSYGAITKPGWYIHNAQYNRPIASLEPFKHCPWCAAKLAKI